MLWGNTLHIHYSSPISFSGLVMVNFIYQLDKATVPEYLVNHWFGCCREGTFGMKLRFKSKFE